MRYSIKVYVRRNDQPCYSYTAESRVKPAKVDRILRQTARDIIEHEMRSGYGSWPVTRWTGNGIAIRISGLRFIVKAWRVEA